jgi:mono/diheme cytochrome c family protein
MWLHIGRAVAAVVVVSLVGALAVLLGVFETSVVPRDIDRPLTAEQMQALVPKGRYLVNAADCYACHSQRKGPAWAGGLPIATPVGTIYATNITPDTETGIGRWTRADFHHALRDGIGRDGRHLYPAMPYTAFRGLMTEDVDAIYAYLMTREPIRLTNRDNALSFPFNLRGLMAFWNLVNLDGNPVKPDQKRSAEWNRGDYVVNALGHCGECHTPRTAALAPDAGRRLQGTMIEGVEAPDITPAGLATLGFDRDDLTTFMRSGLALQGAMTNQMFDVVHYSTQYLSDADLSAMVTYLFDDAPPAAKPVVPVAAEPRVAEAGRRVYVEVCAGCHGPDGEGIPHVSVPMRTNSSVRLASPRNFLHTVLFGIPEQKFPGLERMQPMSAFADRLDDQQIADLAGWLRSNWGGRLPDVTRDTVAQARR